MEVMGFFLVFSVLVGLVLRLSGGRERAGRLRPGTPARFLQFTGRRLRVSIRTTESLPPE